MTSSIQLDTNKAIITCSRIVLSCDVYTFLRSRGGSIFNASSTAHNAIHLNDNVWTERNMLHQPRGVLEVHAANRARVLWTFVTAILSDVSRQRLAPLVCLVAKSALVLVFICKKKIYMRGRKENQLTIYSAVKFKHTNDTLLTSNNQKHVKTSRENNQCSGHQQKKQKCKATNKCKCQHKHYYTKFTNNNVLELKKKKTLMKQTIATPYQYKFIDVSYLKFQTLLKFISFYCRQNTNRWFHYYFLNLN